jgi:hypothetical protein
MTGHHIAGTIIIIIVTEIISIETETANTEMTIGTKCPRRLHTTTITTTIAAVIAAAPRKLSGFGCDPTYVSVSEIRS